MNEVEQVIRGFRDLYNKMAFLNKFKMEASLKGYKASEVHCIEYVGHNRDCNVTKLAEILLMTRGAISKRAKKLIQKGILESYQRPDNQKEIYFRLTARGEAVYKAHEELHKEFQERDKAIFEQVSDEQIEVMLGFIEKYNRHLDAEIKKQGLDITNQTDSE